MRRSFKRTGFVVPFATIKQNDAKEPPPVLSLPKSAVEEKTSDILFGFHETNSSHNSPNSSNVVLTCDSNVGIHDNNDLITSGKTITAVCVASGDTSLESSQDSIGFISASIKLDESSIDCQEFEDSTSLVGSSTSFDFHEVEASTSLVDRSSSSEVTNPDDSPIVLSKTSKLGDSTFLKRKRLFSETSKTSSSVSKRPFLQQNQSQNDDDDDSSLSTQEIKKMNSSKNDIEIFNEKRYFNVLYCKRSTKKHKTWEGDAILIVKGRSAALKDLSGKDIATGLGYKVKEIAQIEEGGKFFVGMKECEIQNQIPEDEYLSGKCFQTAETVEVSPVNSRPHSISKKFHCPFVVLPPKEIKVLPQVVKPPRDPAYLYMPEPNPLHQQINNPQKLPVVDVRVDLHIGQHLRSHQKEGITFMYECIQGFRDYSGYGAILGDEMGLGKTLQCIALIWTLVKQGPYGNHPILKKVLIITPSSLVKNWEAEFFKWLGRERIAVFAVGAKNKVSDFVNSRYTVLIISYEMYVRSAKTLSPVKFDLVICDEGHRLKNVNIKTSEVIMSMPTKRRILLSGTPIQNDLEEFYAIVEFVNPGILGSISAFRRIYQVPIIKSHNPLCTEEEKRIGNARALELSNKIKSFFLRRTQDVINKYLPPKFEAVVFVQPTEIQCSLYKHLLQSKHLQSTVLQDFDRGCGGVVHLQYISLLRKLCNHPSLLYTEQPQEQPEDIMQEFDPSMLDYMRSAFPEDYTFEIGHSGKLGVLENLLVNIFSSQSKEKIVLVSNFTQTLNIIESLCKKHSYCYLRLDGSTSSAIRLELVDKFNASYTKYCIFLLSSKAGGVGLNLIGASRIILYDIDWNPATDLQAMARVWRDGQKKPVYVYRLLTTGTIEEKIYQRQVTKQGLSGTVIDTSFTYKSQFSYEDLKDIFRLHESIECLTHDLLGCNCLAFRDSTVQSQIGGKENQPLLLSPKVNSQKNNTSMAQLLRWKHIPQPFKEVPLPNSYLDVCAKGITFLFTNCVNVNNVQR